MAGRPHYLPPNKSSALPARFIFVDTETRQWTRPDGYNEHRLRLGVAMFWQRPAPRQPERETWRDFRSAGEWWAWVERHTIKGRRLVIVAHNAGFDLQVLGGPTALRERGWIVTKARVDRWRTIIRAERDGASILVLDSANYFRMPLREVARRIAIEYVPLPPDGADDETWRVRCHNDVRILAAAFRRWISLCDDLDLGHFAETIAKQAMNAFRHRLTEHAVAIHKFEDVSAHERAAYFGARIEAYRIGPLPTQTYHKLDINSAYAAVMKSKPYPTAFVRTIRRLDADTLRAELRRHLAIATVEIETDEPVYPTRHMGRLVFPVGRFTTTLATPELLHALTHGRVRAVGRTQLYTGANIFKRAVTDLYGARARYALEGREFEAGLMKSLLVSLYGRFGMRVAEWSHVGDEPELPDDRWDEFSTSDRQLHEYRRIGGRVEERGDEEDARETFVAIPAHVTSYARMLQWHYLMMAGRPSVYYTNTDSFIVDDDGLRALSGVLSPTELGKLKTEGSTDRVEIAGASMFRWGERVVQKGRSAAAEDIGGFDYRQTEFVSMSSAMRLHHIGGPLSRVVSKVMSRTYAIGDVQADGRVLPLRLG